MKIVITGPESSGKTTLLNDINNKWNFTIIPEYARIYIDKLNRPYNYDDILEIAKGQIALEDNSEYSGGSTLLFADTDLLTLQIWCEYKYNKCHPFIIEKLKINLPDLYLICSPKIPWEFDSQRENPHDRIELYNIHLDKIKKMGISYEIIEGDLFKRLIQSKKILQNL